MNGKKLEKGILRRGCGKWDVKINNQSFENGWAKFAEDNGLEVGDLSVFRHEGEMEFEIIVFDPTACERDYPFEDEKRVHTREVVEFPNYSFHPILRPRRRDPSRKEQQRRSAQCL